MEHPTEGSRRVGAPTEPEQIDAVTVLIEPDDSCVAIDDVRRDSEAGRLADKIINPTNDAFCPDMAGVRL